MSQAGVINTTSGPVPPAVPTSFVTDSGTAIPVANILNVNGGETNVDNDFGIRTTGSGNNLTVQLTNRVTGKVNTTDATPTTVVSLSLGSTPGVYVIEGNLAAFNVTDAAGGSYTFIGAARTDGVNGIEIASEDKNVFEEAAMAAADFSYGVSGNTASLTVTGIAGKTIHWDALITYRFIS